MQRRLQNGIASVVSGSNCLPQMGHLNLAIVFQCEPVQKVHPLCFVSRNSPN
ncbi:hypothetical protein THTE_3623 [Thermogutta terrifontis]|uniref:Uncharacterized protein n=1 Tax=Thermogutta terrifontis TaxID=1331910 RepID=A0A286RJV7_9BACT|nr:hypothetical protein THTE_3623 [Thermogutta terrifontis]